MVPVQLPLLFTTLLHSAKAAVKFNDNDYNQPVKSGLPAWVDADTPEDKYEITSSRGDVWYLVMSDEFEMEGRNFSAGVDHLWTALDIPDGVNKAMGYYSPENTYTEDGKFVIRVDEGPVNGIVVSAYT